MEFRTTSQRRTFMTRNAVARAKAMGARHRMADVIEFGGPPTAGRVDEQSWREVWAEIRAEFGTAADYGDCRASYLLALIDDDR